jgi:integrase
LPGFGLRVEPSGVKTFFVRYRASGGGRKAPSRLLVIGRYGALTLDEARAEARKLLARVRLGGDPAAERKSKRELPTFREYAGKVLDDAEEIAKERPEEAKLRPRTIGSYRSLLDVHVGPAIGGMKVDAIRMADVERMHNRVGKTNPAVANRCVAFVSAMFARAAKEYSALAAAPNPAKGVKHFKETARERFLSVAEVVALGEAIREAETVGIEWAVDKTKPASKHMPKKNRRTVIDRYAAAALRLLIFTGARVGEVLKARWDGVDLERGIMFVHGKTGRRAVILPPPAIEILAKLPRLNSFVFPGDLSDPDTDAPRYDLNRPWRAVQRRAGLEGVRIHDLRHSFASFAAAGGAALPVIGKLLGHTQPQTTLRYSHLADDPLRAVSNRVAKTIGAALSGKPSADILTLKEAI